MEEGDARVEEEEWLHGVEQVEEEWLDGVEQVEEEEEWVGGGRGASEWRGGLFLTPPPPRPLLRCLHGDMVS